MAAALILALCSSGLAEGRELKDVRLGINGEVSRFVLEVDDAIEYKIFSLADPYRIVVDVSETEFGSQFQGNGRGIVSHYRFGLYKAGTSRVVLDLNAPAVVKAAFVISPRDGFGHRLVIDLAPTSRAAFLAALQRPEEAAPPPPPPQEARPPSEQAAGGRKMIVIDPGHGGVDPGASSVNGEVEKDITLRVARVVRDELERSGIYAVKLTRDRDIFIPLRDRFQIARAAGANLFVSLHADSFKTGEVRGGSVYTLSERASDSEAELLAAKENKADIIAGIDLGDEPPEVSNILIDLARRETMNFSAHFATILVNELGQVMPLRRNSHRFAGFVVLKAPDVPSVLFEMGYLSNAKDAAGLVNAAQQRRIAAAVKRALDQYFLKLASQ